MKVERVIDIIAYMMGVAMLGKVRTLEIMEENPIYRASYKGVVAYGRTYHEAITRLFSKFVFDVEKLGIKKDAKGDKMA